MQVLSLEVEEPQEFCEDSLIREGMSLLQESHLTHKKTITNNG